jgi:hypothetical protein
LNEIEYTVEYVTPRESKWFLLELSIFKSMHSSTKIVYKNSSLVQTKKLMSDLGFCINIDFKISPDYYGNTIKILLHPEQEQYASWIALHWERVKQEYE